MELLVFLRSAELELIEQAKILQDIVPVIDFYPDLLTDSSMSNLHVLKTTTRKLTTIEYGTFIARTIQLYNPLDKWEEGETGRIKKYVSTQVTTLIKGKKRFSSEFMCMIGQLRFLENRTREEIQIFLEENYSVAISTGAISTYSLEFLLRLKLYHDKHFDLISTALQKNGGYILGADGTGDGGSKRILLLMDLLKGWTLSATYIPTEKSDFIIPLFKDLIAKAGEPLAYVRDMGKGLRRAGEELFLTIPTRECTFHFLRDVGKDLMTDTYQEFRNSILRTKIKPGLVKLRKSILHQAILAHVDLKKAFQLLKDQSHVFTLSREELILIETYHLISWILNYSADNKAQRFPYCLPLVYLFQRCRSGEVILKDILQTAQDLGYKPDYLQTLQLLMKNLSSENILVNLEQLEKNLLESYAYFTRLRTILRLSQTSGDIPRDQLDLPDQELQKVEQELTLFKTELSKKIELQPDVKDSNEQIVLRHLNQHWDYLIVPNLTLNLHGEQKERVIPRAISLADSRFGKIKNAIRKRTGRKDTGYDLNQYGVLLSYLENLQSDEYIELMFTSVKLMPKFLDSIPQDEVRSAIEDYKLIQGCIDFTNASSSTEFEDFSKMVSIISTEAVSSMMTK